MPTEVVLVDEHDNFIGLAEKMAAHTGEGKPHRGVSIGIIYDRQGRVIIQQRAATKYHCPDKWSALCCGHPQEGESYKEAAKNRLQQEIGITIELQEAFKGRYSVELGGGLCENELGKVFLGFVENCDELTFKLDSREVSSIKILKIEKLVEEMIQEQQKEFTPWFLFMIYRRA